MIYATRTAAAAVQFYLNNMRGYAPAYLYRSDRNTYTVVRAYCPKRQFTDTAGTWVLTA